MSVADVLVIGGGPAGAAAAARLAAAGLGVTLCERQREPGRQVCGEFVSAIATAELAALGVEPVRLGAAAIGRTRICAQHADVTAPLPFTSYGLSRARLDRNLLALAVRRGASVRSGAAVRALERHHGAWTATLRAGARLAARAVVLASGKHDLRGHARAADDAAAVVGFKMHYRLASDQAAALEGAVELFLYDGGYAGLQPIEDGLANLCLVMRADRVRGWQSTLSLLRTAAPALAARLQGARPLWDRPASVARVPYGYVCAGDATVDGLYRVGDQAAVIPSLAGEGIAIALRSARRAADAVLAGDPAASYVAAVRSDVVGPMRRAMLIEKLRHRPALCRVGLGVARVPGVVPLLARLTRLPLPA